MLMCGVKNRKVEPHIPTPYKEGNKVLREYFEEKITSTGMLQISTYVDYENKKGELEERYLMRVKFIKSDMTNRNISELNQLTLVQIGKEMESHVHYFGKDFSSSYITFLSKYLSRRIRLEMANKQFYEQL